MPFYVSLRIPNLTRFMVEVQADTVTYILGCCGWSQVTPLSSIAWQASSSAPCQPCESYTSTSMIHGMRLFFRWLLNFFSLVADGHSKAVRMGQHAWLLFATICTEVLLIFKWGRGVFTAPFPTHIKWCLTLGGIVVVLYPTIKV